MEDLVQNKYLKMQYIKKVQKINNNLSHVHVIARRSHFMHCILIKISAVGLLENLIQALI